MPSTRGGARQGALLAGVLLVGLAVARWGMPVTFTRRAAILRREHSPADDARRGTLGDPVADAWSEAVRADVALAERNDRYAG